MDEAFTALTGAGLPVTAACRLVGRARASHYRHVRPPVQGPRPRRAPGPQALTPAGICQVK
jgi:putative transposase